MRTSKLMICILIFSFVSVAAAQIPAQKPKKKRVRQNEKHLLVEITTGSIRAGFSGPQPEDSAYYTQEGHKLVVEGPANEVRRQVRKNVPGLWKATKNGQKTSIANVETIAVNNAKSHRSIKHDIYNRTHSTVGGTVRVRHEGNVGVVHSSPCGYYRCACGVRRPVYTCATGYRYPCPVNGWVYSHDNPNWNWNDFSFS